MDDPGGKRDDVFGFVSRYIQRYLVIRGSVPIELRLPKQLKGAPQCANTIKFGWEAERHSVTVWMVAKLCDGCPEGLEPTHLHRRQNRRLNRPDGVAVGGVWPTVSAI